MKEKEKSQSRSNFLLASRKDQNFAGSASVQGSQEPWGGFSLNSGKSHFKKAEKRGGKVVSVKVLQIVG